MLLTTKRCVCYNTTTRKWTSMQMLHAWETDKRRKKLHTTTKPKIFASYLKNNHSHTPVMLWQKSYVFFNFLPLSWLSEKPSTSSSLILFSDTTLQWTHFCRVWMNAKSNNKNSIKKLTWLLCSLAQTNKKILRIDHLQVQGVQTFYS